MAERARRSVGGTLQASRAALAEGLAGSLGGGTHHASSDRGGGFCVFNDIAVAARLMQAEQAAAGRPPLRVLVIDLDVHQGNGTASIFGGDDSVFTFSMHGARNFPFRKVASDLDVELPDDCEDAAYLAALDQALAQLDLGHQAAPFGLIYYQAGVDVHVADRLGRLSLSDAGVAERDARVFDWALRRRLPLVLTMGGGYAEPITTTVRLQRQTWGLALQAWQRWQDELHTAARGLVDIGG
jgi:acetoin utilization deacetylase AcuC-like enzyme